MTNLYPAQIFVGNVTYLFTGEVRHSEDGGDGIPVYKRMDTKPRFMVLDGGNPEFKTYVCEYRCLLTDEEVDSKVTVRMKYAAAVSRASQIGGFEYSLARIAFVASSEEDVSNAIAELMLKISK
jgi:hypothetical protein